MKLINSCQCAPEELQRVTFDLALMASGYESRSSYVAQSLQPNARRRIALGFHDRRLLCRDSNDQLYEQLGYTVVEANGGSARPIQEFTGLALDETKEPEINILVDYTSMTRVWYAGRFRC